jgi:hypothetical protein
VATLALAEPGTLGPATGWLPESWRATATRDGDRYLVNGVKDHVPTATSHRYFKRATANRLLAGDATSLRRLIGARIGWGGPVSASSPGR